MRPSEIARLLPEVYQRTIRPASPLAALLEVMEGLQSPAEAVLDDLDGFWDPYRAPERFLPFLAHWVDLEGLLAEAPTQTAGLRTAGTAPCFAAGPGRLRELIATAATLSKWRGTERGLRLFLEVATGIEGFQIDSQARDADGQVRPFHILVRVPRAASPYWSLIQQIVEREKPAYVTYDLELGEP